MKETLISLLIVSIIIFGLGILLKHEGDRIQKKEDVRLIESYSRMSDSDQVQEAYDRIHPLGNEAYDTLAFECP